MRRLPTALISTVSVVAFTQIALATDMPPIYSWTGFYIGANIGYGWNGSSATESPGDSATGFPIGGQTLVGPASTSFDTRGWAGGFQAGYNWQFNPRWMAGVKTDFDWSSIKGGNSVGANLLWVQPWGIFSANQKVDWFGTVRARLGYLPTNDFFVYATGGLAYGKVNESADLGITFPNGGPVNISGVSYNCQNPPIPGVSSTCFAGANSRTSMGWTVGGGAEYRFAQKFSVKLEYLYVNLGSSGTIKMPAPTPAPGTVPAVLNVVFDDATFSLVRVGLNYHF